MAKLRAISLISALALLVGLSFVGRVNAPGPNLSTNSGVASYLRAHGLDPGKFVIQRGLRNYAGPHCPGTGWNCTVSIKVVQVGDKTNVFECPAGNSCTATQGTTPTGSTDNEFVCEQRPEDDGSGSPQSCTVTQLNGSGDNRVNITQVIRQEDGTAQVASQTATVKQTSVSGSNFAKVVQTIAQSIKEDAAAQSQTATQMSTFMQLSTSGGNTISLVHNLKQSERTDMPGGTQDQRSFETGSIHQTSSGLSVFKVDQDAHQKMEGTPTTTQNQDPDEFCCANQAGNVSDAGVIAQNSVQDSDMGASQQTRLRAECQSSGNCMATQKATQNGVTLTNTASGPFVFINVNCTDMRCSTGGET